MASLCNRKKLINSQVDEKAIWNEKLTKQKVDEMISRWNGTLMKLEKKFIKSQVDEKESRN